MDIKKIIGPTAILTVIVAVVTVLLVLTNGATEAQIAELQAASEEEAKMEVLAEADGFTEATVNVDGTDYTYFEATNGAGYVFTASYKGYGGPVVCMIGISANGEVTGVKLTDQNETPGLGQKALNASFTDQYKGEIPADGKFDVIKDDPNGEINAIAGATITSRAVTNSVDTAIDIFNVVTGGAQ